MRAPRLHQRFGDTQQGAAIVVVMMFAFVFVIMGIALFQLVRSSQTGTELERREIKAFNVAEAGIDAGMLALELAWPDASTRPISVDNSLLKSALQTRVPALWDPKNPTEFIDVDVYDNIDGAGAVTTTPTPNTTRWDSNNDGRMFVDSWANVDNGRHRIIILAQRQAWNVSLPFLAMYANAAGAQSNGGIRVWMETSPPAGIDIYARWIDTIAKGVTTTGGILLSPNDTNSFDSFIDSSLIAALLGIAKSQQTYFEDPGGATAAQAVLETGALGKVIYVKSSGAINLAGNRVEGSVDQPVVLILDTPTNASNILDLRGTNDFYGAIISLGNLQMQGTATIHGMVCVAGTLDSNGRGSSPEIYYNHDVLKAINRQYVISVNIVPNTWEEFTVPPGS